MNGCEKKTHIEVPKTGQRFDVTHLTPASKERVKKRIEKETKSKTKIVKD